jgi:hypothetical protein
VLVVEDEVVVCGIGGGGVLANSSVMYGGIVCVVVCLERTRGVTNV